MDDKIKEEATDGVNIYSIDDLPTVGDQDVESKVVFTTNVNSEPKNVLTITSEGFFDCLGKQIRDTEGVYATLVELTRCANDDFREIKKQARLEALRECRNKLSILTGAYSHVIDGFVSVEQMEAIIDNLITQTEND